jgi:hypothetical protein
MKKKLLSMVFVAGLLLVGITGTVFAGVEPSPFQPEINRLHSIRLNMAITQKGLDNLVIAPSLPRGTKAGLLAIKYELYVLDTQLGNILEELPPYDEQDLRQKGVLLALGGIRIDALSMEDPLDYILSRLGIGPSPFKEILDSITGRIDQYFRPSCVPEVGATCFQ